MRYKRAYIEITNRCNLSCGFCPSSSLGRTGRLMSTEEFKKVIDQVSQVTDYVYFHLLGEPLLHPRLAEFFEICEAAGLQVNLTTNGTLLPRAARLLSGAKALRQVNVSLHAFEANEGLELEGYFTGIFKAADQIQAGHDVFIHYRLWNMDTEELKAKNGLNGQVFALLEETFLLDFSLADRLQEKGSIRLRSKTFLQMAEKFQWPSLGGPVISEEIFCHGLRDHFGVLADGTVVPCCLDSEGGIPLGSIFEKPLAQILSGSRARGIYDGFSRRQAVEALCKTCGYASKL